MYRKVEDFLEDWETSSKGTIKVLKTITNDTMGQAIVEGHNTLGWLGWHLVVVGTALSRYAGFEVPGPDFKQEIPKDITEIINAYEQFAETCKKEAKKLTDEQLVEEVDGFWGLISRGKLLRNMIKHQTHHLGQMTVLLRQAGLPVPGIMGPTKEMRNK